MMSSYKAKGVDRVTRENRQKQQFNSELTGTISNNQSKLTRIIEGIKDTRIFKGTKGEDLRAGDSMDEGDSRNTSMPRCFLLVILNN